MKILILVTLLFSTVFSDVYYYEYGKKVELIKLKEPRDVDSEAEFYQNSAGQKIGVKNEILVKCNSKEGCEKVFIKYNLKDIETLGSDIFLIKLNDTHNLFELSRELYNEECITISHPNFMKKRYKR